jgi:hypothetical protein
MESKKQTAVGWFNQEMLDLLIKLDKNKISSIDYIKEYNKNFRQAKEMEKQQIIDAREDGHDCTYAEYGETPKCYLDGSSEQYYNETFKQ